MGTPVSWVRKARFSPANAFCRSIAALGFVGIRSARLRSFAEVAPAHPLQQIGVETESTPIAKPEARTAEGWGVQSPTHALHVRK